MAFKKGPVQPRVSTVPRLLTHGASLPFLQGQSSLKLRNEPKVPRVLFRVSLGVSEAGREENL